MSKARILFVDLGSDYGGVETYLRRLCPMLSPYCECFALLSLPKLAEQLRTLGVHVVCIPMLGPRWLKGLRLLLSFLIVPYMLLRYRVRVVQLNGFFESLLIVPVRLAGCKAIFTMHIPFETDLYSWVRNPERYFPRLLSKLSLRFATRVVCVSETIGRLARSVVSAEKVTVIANWVEAPAAISYSSWSASQPRLLFVGRLEQYKGAQLILQAMRQIPGASLLVVGEGSYRSRLEEWTGKVDVEFAGFQDDPVRFYEHSTVFINPSLGPEGLPLVSLEAMAHGVPCLFSDLPVHQEISANGSAAALFHRGSSDDLARQLKTMLADASMRQEYSRAARQLIENKYSTKAATGRYVQAFGL